MLIVSAPWRETGALRLDQHISRSHANVDVDSRQKNADDWQAGEVLKAREQASFLIYTPWATSLRMPKASRLIIRRLFSQRRSA